MINEMFNLYFCFSNLSFYSRILNTLDICRSSKMIRVFLFHNISNFQLYLNKASIQIEHIVPRHVIDTPTARRIFRKNVFVYIFLEVIVLFVVVHPELGTGVAGQCTGLTITVAVQKITQTFLGSILK